MFATPVVGALLAALTALAPTVIDVGHTDSPKAYWDDTANTFALMTDNGALEKPVPIEETVSWLKADDTWTVPDDEAYSSFGNPGDTYYASPENVGMNWDTKLWQGIGADAGVPVDRFRDATFSLDLVDFSGPGEMTMFQDAVNPGESPVIFLSSARPGRQWTPLTAGSHTHLNTVFTRPGLYRLTYRATARLVDGSVIASTPQQTTWWVGDERLVPTPDPDAPQFTGNVRFDDTGLTLTADAPGVAIFYVDGHELAQVQLADGTAHFPRPKGEGMYEAQFVSEDGAVWGTVSEPTAWDNKPELVQHDLATPDYVVTNTVHEGYHEVSVTGPEPVHVTGGVYETAEDTNPTCEFNYVATPDEPAQRYTDYCTEGLVRATLTPHPLVNDAPSQQVSFPAGDGQATASFAEHEEITAGHVDIGPVVENGTVVMRIMDKSIHRPDSTALVVDGKARRTRSTGRMLDSAYDFIGPKGTEFSLLEQSGANQQSQVWPGFSTEHLPLELRQQGWDIEVEKVSDTGWFGFLTGLSGPTMLLPGRIENAGHLHLNWIFLDTGDHKLRVRAVNRTTGEATDWETVTFRVKQREKGGEHTTPGEATPEKPKEEKPHKQQPGENKPDGEAVDKHVEVRRGHVDMAFKSGRAYFDIDGVGKRDSGAVTFVVPGGVIPFTQDQDLPWLGFSWSPVGGTVRLARMEGPGTMTVFTPDTFGERHVHLASDSDSTLRLDGDHGHAHYAFTFSAPGTYDVDFAFTGDDGSTATLRARFDVGAAADETNTQESPSTQATTPRAPGAPTKNGKPAPKNELRARGPYAQGQERAERASGAPGAKTAARQVKKNTTSHAAPKRSHDAKKHAIPRAGGTGEAGQVLSSPRTVQAAVEPTRMTWAAGVATGAGGAFLLVGVGLLGVAVGRRQRS